MDSRPPSLGKAVVYDAKYGCPHIDEFHCRQYQPTSPMTVCLVGLTVLRVRWPKIQLIAPRFAPFYCAICRILQYRRKPVTILSIFDKDVINHTFIE